MDHQTLFNVAIGAAGLFGGYVLTRIYSEIDKLDGDVRKIPVDYVRKDDFKTAIGEVKQDLRLGFQHINQTLESISDRIHKKVDKP